MIFSIFLATVSAFPLFKRDATLPSNCKVLDTLFVQCANGNSQAPSIYAPQCTIDGTYGIVECCAVTPDGQQTSYCQTSGSQRDNGCKVLDTLLQLECRSDNGGYSLQSPICSGSSDGSGQCCARNEDGSKSSQCSSTPPTSQHKCIILDDLTTQCDNENGVIRTPPQCESNGSYRKCCAVYQDGSEAGKCYAVA